MLLAWNNLASGAPSPASAASTAAGIAARSAGL
jgi:hypothetical protein